MLLQLPTLFFINFKQKSNTNSLIFACKEIEKLICFGSPVSDIHLFNYKNDRTKLKKYLLPKHNKLLAYKEFEDKAKHLFETEFIANDKYITDKYIITNYYTLSEEKILPLILQLQTYKYWTLNSLIVNYRNSVKRNFFAKLSLEIKKKKNKALFLQ